MDSLQTCLDALEQQLRTMTRQLHWWRGMACGLLVLAVLTWALPLSTAQESARSGGKRLAQRVAALEDLLKHFSREGNDVFITGANLHIRNGLGSTTCEDEQGESIPNCPNGLGNVIVGYNEPRPGGNDIRTGSHNVVVGIQHNFSRFGGLVVGSSSEISGDFAAVSGGVFNTASNFGASVSGGIFNIASGAESSVSGGRENMAKGRQDAILGGALNTTTRFSSVVSGGADNTASGDFAAVSGGQFNTANGDRASVSGGQNITQDTEFGWAAGSEADEVVVGNFRSP
jgi:hypothetical protein